jgi:hypothetical protein
MSAIASTSDSVARPIRRIAVADNCYVRFGSLADIGTPTGDVRFAPLGGHAQRRNRCPLCTNSRALHVHQVFEITLAFR